MTSQFSSNVFASVEHLYSPFMLMTNNVFSRESLSVLTHIQITLSIEAKGRLCGFHFTLDYRGIN